MGTKRGPADPERRERILAAAERLLLEHGIARLSHRAVAREAGVPLGSTTYYFATLNDLLDAATRRLTARYAEWLHAWGEGLGEVSPAQLVEALADLVEQQIREARDVVVLSYELMTAAMRRPELRESALLYAATEREVLSRHTDPRTAAALVTTLDGLLMQSLAAATPLTRTQLTEPLAAILTPEE
ncbi:TetR family transcriptional regulator [Streptomyces sp. HNM0574]|uniref:TetR/AcrR family transcriptional regulator n=1 Tax=Streptomyces sp. HNM0574 TaxID=2714954 RepID=UPI00146CB75A|nr:TetR family transcriptional regulator [Streptomyces sp. HNM0574]NLU67768.1 TetR family transcriptional regulator [Streptomyces sp. HNM0574]